jgi:predicted  nucleic acid-binding Zn-ribbon protein
MEKRYKSPLQKLVNFFEDSRDKWKEKCQKAKADIKGYKKRIIFLEESKANLKQQLSDLKEENKTLQSQLGEGSKKKT